MNEYETDTIIGREVCFIVSMLSFLLLLLLLLSMLLLLLLVLVMLFSFDSFCCSCSLPFQLCQIVNAFAIILFPIQDGMFIDRCLGVFENKRKVKQKVQNNEKLY